jgi:hypothetical protein
MSLLIYFLQSRGIRAQEKPRNKSAHPKEATCAAYLSLSFYSLSQSLHLSLQSAQAAVAAAAPLLTQVSYPPQLPANPQALMLSLIALASESEQHSLHSDFLQHLA